MVRKSCWLVLAVLTLVWSTAALGAEMGVSKGFGDAPWGSDVSKRPGFVKIKSLDGVDYFVNLRERVEVKDFERPTIFYGAVGGKLYAVHLRLKDAAAYDALRKDMSQAFGPGRQENLKDARQTRWRTGSLKVKLKAASRGEVKLSFYYQPIATKQAVNLRDVEPGPSEDLLKLMPAGENPLLAPPGQSGPQKDYSGAIDLRQLLRMGKGL